MSNKRISIVTWAAMIAACYVVVTLALAPISYGEIQVRISEALTILPLFTPAAIPGLFIGCIIANALGGAVLPDIIFGSLATLIGAVGTYLIGRNIGRRTGTIGIATIPPIVSNAVIVPFVLKYAYGVPLPIPLMMLTVGIGEVISCGILGTTLGRVLERNAGRVFK